MRPMELAKEPTKGKGRGQPTWLLEARSYLPHSLTYPPKVPAKGLYNGLRSMSGLWRSLNGGRGGGFAAYNERAGLGACALDL